MPPVAGVGYSTLVMIESSRLARVADLSASMMAILSEDGLVEEANASFGRLAPGERAVGKPFVDFVHEDEHLAASGHLRRLASEPSVTFRVRLRVTLERELTAFAQFEATRTSDGAVVLVGIPSPSLPTAAESDAAATATFELVEQQLAHFERHVTTAELLSKALSLAPVILWANDGDGRVTHLEGGGLEQAGLEAITELTKLNFFEKFADHPEFLDGLRRTLTGETCKRITSLGSATFESWLVPSHDDRGAVNGVVGLAVDISDRIKGELALRAQLERIERQAATIRSLTTPVIQLWKDVLCLPVVGTVDSVRAADMMDTLLSAIVRSGPRYAVLDLTGVEIVDTSTAELLLRIFQAARLVGTDGVLCGIRPAVAQAITGLGVDLTKVRTMRSLQTALEWCMEDARAKDLDDDLLFDDSAFD